MNKTVSIILPCYNVGPYLDQCLDSLTRQTLADLEIICINDGSADETSAVLHAWAEKDFRIRVIDCENGGQASARNRGMDVAQGEYIGFVDPDDYVEHTMYSRLLEEARRHDADVTACGYTSFSHRDGSVLESLSLSPASGVEKDLNLSMFYPDCVWMGMDVVAWNKLYKREFLHKAGLRFEPSFRRGEDDVFWLMLLPHAGCLAAIPERLYWYRRQREGTVFHQWEEQGCPYALDMDRLEYVAAYWKRIGWLEAAARQGWLAHLMKRYLLSHVSSAEEIFQRLDPGKGRDLLRRYREWLRGTGISPEFFCLNRWDRAFCRLLLAEPVKVGRFSRIYHTCMSACNGRRGRYHRLQSSLSRLG